MSTTNLFASSRHTRIRDVPAIPDQEVGDPINRRDRDVVCIGPGAHRQRPAVDERLREGRDSIVPENERDSRECRYTTTRHERFPTPRFFKSLSGREQPVVVATVVPPFASLALAPGHQRVAAGAGDEVADDAGFDVDGGEHAGRLTTPPAPHNRARKSRSAGGLKRCGGAPLRHPRSQAARSQVRCRASRPAPALRRALGRRRGGGTLPGPGGSGRRCCSASAPPSWAR